MYVCIGACKHNVLNLYASICHMSLHGIECIYVYMHNEYVCVRVCVCVRMRVKMFNTGGALFIVWVYQHCYTCTQCTST